MSIKIIVNEVIDDPLSALSNNQRAFQPHSPEYLKLKVNGFYKTLSVNSDGDYRNYPDSFGNLTAVNVPHSILQY